MRTTFTLLPGCHICKVSVAAVRHQVCGSSGLTLDYLDPNRVATGSNTRTFLTVVQETSNYFIESAAGHVPTAFLLCLAMLAMTGRALSRRQEGYRTTLLLYIAFGYTKITYTQVTKPFVKRLLKFF